MSEMFSPTELINVAKLSKWNILEILLNGVTLFNFDIDIKDDEGNALIHILVQKSFKLFEKAVKKGANINLVNRDGKTALHLAVEAENQAAVHFLINAGVDQSVKDSMGETALFKAAANGYYEIVKLLIDKNGDYDPITSINDKGCNLLHVCVQHIDIVKLLISSGIPVNYLNADKLSPLHVAVAKGYYEATKLLITNGAYIDCFYDYGKRQSLLQLALEHKHDVIAKTLIEMRINVDYRNSQGETPLHTAVTTQSFTILKALLKSRACVNVTDDDGYAPLHLTAEIQEAKFAKALLSKGALINLQTSNGDSVLHRAASLGNIPVSECLLNYGSVDVNLLNNDGCTPLHLAADNGHVLMVDYLVNYGADISLLDGFKRTFVFTCSTRKQPLKEIKKRRRINSVTLRVRN